MTSFVHRMIVSCIGVGYIRPFSASWGSLAVGLAMFTCWPELSLTLKLATTMLTFLIGALLSDQIEQKDKLHDPHFIVIDEAVGMMIVTLFLAANWQHWLLAFVLFRFFDIVKLWPASIFDKRSGGFAIMIDDVIAAIYSLLALHAILPLL